MCFCQDLIGSDFVVMVDCRVFSQVWNLANCKLKTNHIGHTGYVNTVTVSPDGSLCASGGKVSFPLAALIWVFGTLVCILVCMNVWCCPCVCVQDGQAMLWDLNEGKHLYTLDSGDVINALCFSPNRYWLCAATGPSIKIWVWAAITFPRWFELNTVCFSFHFNSFLCLYFCCFIFVAVYIRFKSTTCTRDKVLYIYDA